MINTEDCSKSKSFEQRRKKMQIKKLHLLEFIRDNLERRLSSINASIETMQKQIDRYKDIN